jgi:serine/threonine protein kinase
MEQTKIDQVEMKEAFVLDCIPDYPEVKLIRTLGYGYIGTTYLTEDDTSSQYVTKLEKFDGDTSLKSSYGRQLAFDRDVAQKHPDLFMTIQSSKIVENSKHIQKVPARPGFDERVSAIVNARKHAFIFNYLPLLDGTYGSVSDKLNQKQELDMLYQVVKGIRAMTAAGYRHRDISARNIMYKKLPDGSLKWYIIDYGSVWHKSFLINDDDKYYEKHRQNDIVATVLMVTKNKLFDYAKSRGYMEPKFFQLASYIKRHKVFREVSKYLPNTSNIDDKTLVLATEIYDNRTYAKICLNMDSRNTQEIPSSVLVNQLNGRMLLYMLKYSESNCGIILSEMEKYLP